MWLIFLIISFVGILILTCSLIMVLINLYRGKMIEGYYKAIAVGFMVFIGGILLAPDPELKNAEEVNSTSMARYTKADKDMRAERFAHLKMGMTQEEVIAIMGEGKVTRAEEKIIEIEWGNLLYPKIYKAKLCNGVVCELKVDN